MLRLPCCVTCGGDTCNPSTQKAAVGNDHCQFEANVVYISKFQFDWVYIVTVPLFTAHLQKNFNWFYLILKNFFREYVFFHELFSDYGFLSPYSSQFLPISPSIQIHGLCVSP